MPIFSSPEVQLTSGLSESEKNLGVDLKITADGDLELSNLKDIKLVAGGSNAAQALMLKLGIEPGSLLYHPEIGTDLQIGSKVKDAFTIKTQILNSIYQDPRFDNVDVKVTVLDNTILVDLTVSIVETGLTVPLQFTVAR